jgi:hypothetical protein
MFHNSDRGFWCIYAQNMSRYIQVCDTSYGMEEVKNYMIMVYYLDGNCLTSNIVATLL